MRPSRQLALAVGLLGASACQNLASTPAPRIGPPPREGDSPETAPARRLARLLDLEARGRLPRTQRQPLAAALRVRAQEWEAIGASRAALADLRHAEDLHPVARTPAETALRVRIQRALGDRALALGYPERAKRLYLGAAGATSAPLARWRRAAIHPQRAAVNDLGRAVLRLHREAPEVARRLLYRYLDRGGAAPEVLLAGLRAAREHPDRSVARRALSVLLGRADPEYRAKGCALLGPEEVGCAGSPPPLRCAGERPRRSTPLEEGLLPLALERAGGAGRAGVLEAHRRFGERLRRWNLTVPSPGSAWPVPADGSPHESWALVSRGAEATPADALFRAVYHALGGRTEAALGYARQAAARHGEGSRLLARLQALSGRRRAAGETLLGLREKSPGGVTWLLASLEDLGVLGLAEPAERLATPLMEAAHEDPPVLRALTGLFVAIGEGDRAMLTAERWASLSGDPAGVYRFVLLRFAQAGDARRTARLAGRLLEWTGGLPGPSRCAAAGALRQVGRHAEAGAVEGGNRCRTPWLVPPWPSSWEASPEVTLTRLALLVTVAPPRRGLALTFFAAALADRVGQASRARRILADAWQQDPDRFGAASYRLLAGAARGRRLSALLPWDRIRSERACP